ncbi:MAG: DMT family transporter [Pseudomonadota bacterium]
MHLILLVSITMTAFAANSLLTRYAIDNSLADPNSFAILRVGAGAAVLAALLIIKGSRVHWLDSRRFVGAVSLAAYMIGFSLAYLTLDAGLGALILFGAVQVTMFGYATITGAAPSRFQWIGAVIAFAGLLIALWPGAGTHSDFAGASAMVCAGIGWAVYTISGRTAEDPLAATAVGFTLCLPLLAIVLSPFVEHVTALGVLVAVVCGGVTSGLGYALWYSVLPSLVPAVAAVVQLSVPVIAIVAGALLLGEAITSAVVAAAVLVLSGIALATRKESAPKDRS